MSTNNPNQPAAGASEAQEISNAATESETINQIAEAVTAELPVENVAVPEPAAPEAPSEQDIAAEEEEPAENFDAGMDFGAILAAHERSHRSEISENEVVKGRVVKITDQAVIIDVGFKSEGIVSLAEFKEGNDVTIKPGDDGCQFLAPETVIQIQETNLERSKALRNSFYNEKIGE